MKAFLDFINSGRFSEGMHNIMATIGYGVLIEIFAQDAIAHGLEVGKMLAFAAMVCGIPTAQAVFAKWLRAPADPPAPPAGAP